MTGRIRWGTSSWSERSWVGSFYPAGTKPGDFLARYATRFDTVEVDATYYAIPAARMVDGWERRTPEGFVMSAKFPRSIVHAGEAWRPDVERVMVPEHVDGPTEVFLERMARLGPKLGPLVLQFPWFGRAAPLEERDFLDRLEAYLERLPGGLRVAVEVRNRGWIGDPLLGLLRRRGAALVWTEVKGMPHPAGLAERHDLVTADFAYARLIGDRKATEAACEAFDRVVLDKREDLARWAGLLSSARERVPESYVYANNHYAGHGPGTVTSLRELVEGGTP